MNPPSPSFASQVSGAFFGALVGDALGVPVEFAARAERDADPVTGMRGWGVHHQPPGTWSDDGALFLCTAEGVQEGFSPPRLGALYVRWMTEGHWAARNEVFDIGGATRASLHRLADGVPLARAGATGENENGNGSLMRVLPVALRFHTVTASELNRMAMEASAITHAHLRSQLACAFYCQVAAALLRGDSPLHAYLSAIHEIAPLIPAHSRERIAFARLLDGHLCEIDRTEIFGSGYVIHSLEASIWCLLRYDNFKDAVLAAVNLGEDTDTTGSITGGLAGLQYGIDAIPPDWIDTLPWRNELETLSQTFLRTCQPL